jgi:hypothetical protein
MKVATILTLIFSFQAYWFGGQDAHLHITPAVQMSDTPATLKWEIALGSVKLGHGEVPFNLNDKSADLSQMSATEPATQPTKSFAGKWKWTAHTEDLEIPFTAELSVDKGVVTGRVFNSNLPKGLQIEEGTVKDEVISFKTRQTNSDERTFEAKYSGKRDGDTITGTVEAGWLDVPANTLKITWNAKRMPVEEPRK